MMSQNGHTHNNNSAALKNCYCACEHFVICVGANTWKVLSAFFVDNTLQHPLKSMHTQHFLCNVVYYYFTSQKGTASLSLANKSL